MAGARVVGGRGETLEAERLGSAINYIVVVARGIHLRGVVAYCIE